MRIFPRPKTYLSAESVAYLKNEDSPILLTFNKDGTYSLELNIISCGGSFEISNKKQISIESPVCTEACCDSPFSNKLAITLSKVTTYTDCTFILVQLRLRLIGQYCRVTA